MSEVVFDSSALLAVLLAEPGKLPDELLARAIMSSVNLTEVRTKLIDLGLVTEAEANPALGVLSRIEPFTKAHAMIAANLRIGSRHVGLSLGDRACLALELDSGLPVYTSDRLWSQLDIGCEIHLIR